MYTHFYGFCEKPFNITPDTKFLFFTDSHQKALDSVLYGIGERKGFISISGEAGTGKTTILRYVLETLDEKIKPIFIPQTQITPRQLVKEIIQKLGLTLKDESKISLIRKLHEYLLSVLPQNINLAILIDEAQNLSMEVMEELRMLSNLETSSSKLIQIVFVGQPDLEDNLNSKELRQLKQRIAIRSQIRPLTFDESREYMNHRLRLVGRSLQEIFHPEAAALICRHAEGIPRTINILSDNALLIGFRRREMKIPEGTVKEILSDRGMIAGGNEEIKTPAEGVPPRLSGSRIRNFIPKPVYFGLSGALILILFFLAGMGHMTSLAEKMNFGLGDSQAVTRITAPASEDSPMKEASLPLDQTVSADEKVQLPAANLEKDPPPNVSPKKKDPKLKILAVERGETLYSVLRRNFNRANATLLDHILEANPEIADPNLVKPGDRIRMPFLTEESLIRQSIDGTFRIHLATFAKKEFAERYRSEETLKGKVIQSEARRISSQETWYRVFAGAYPSREESQEAVKVLREKGLLPLFASDS